MNLKERARKGKLALAKQRPVSLEEMKELCKPTRDKNTKAKENQNPEQKEK